MGGDTCKRKALFEAEVSKKMEDTIAKWSGGAGKKQLSYLEVKNARIDARMDSAFCAL